MSMMTPIREETWPYIDEFFRAYPEELRKIRSFQEGLDESEQRGEQRGKQEALLHLLQRKFGQLPSGIVERVEATVNIEQLETWFDQAIDANSLADLIF